MRTDTDIDHFQEMTNFLSWEARKHVLDAIACVFHNEGYSLEGNTEESDVAWIASRICADLRGKRMDQLSEAEKSEMLRIAKVCKDAIPLLADRMAARYIRVSKAVRTLERIAAAQKPSNTQ